MAFSFRDFFFGKLPIYYKINDTYKDINGEGLLERYLRIFGLEIDNNIKPKIDNYLDNIDPFTIDPQYLTTLGYTLGSPPDLTGNPNDYAKLIAYIISIYKIKGTLKAFQLLFALLGYNVTITEYPPSQQVYFDDGSLLDTGLTFDSGCPCCSDYSISVNSLLNPGGGPCSSPNFFNITPALLPLFTQIVEFNAPIDAHLRSIINGGLVCENVIFCYTEDITFTVTSINTFDEGLLMDNGLTFDSNTIVSVTSIHVACPSGGIGFMQIQSTLIVS